MLYLVLAGSPPANRPAGGCSNDWNKNISESLSVYDKTGVLTLYFVVELDMIPGDHTFSNIPEYDYVGTTEQHTPPFVRGQCGDGFVDGPSGQAIRRTTGLIRDVGPEPVACVPPPNPPPTVGSIYHKCMHDTMPTFYTPALADSWHEHSIYARPKRAPRG